MNCCKFFRTRHLWVLLTLFSLVNCGGSSETAEPEPLPTPIQWIQVQATAIGGGTVAPASQRVQAGKVATINLLPNAEHLAVSASGCSGSLSGGTYTTAPLTSDCGVEVRFNGKPVADAGKPQSVNVGSSVRLDASASRDADNDSLSYKWRVVSAPASAEVRLSDPGSVQADFVADKAGEYRFSVQVSDSWQHSDAEVVVTATEKTVQVQAIAIGGGTVSPASQIAQAGTVATINLQPNAEHLAVSASGCSGSLTGETYTTAPLVSDCSVEVRFNGKPVADAGKPQSVHVGSSVRLDASASRDADNDSLSYKWRVVSAPASAEVRLSDPGSVQPDFVANKAGEYRFSVQVSDSWQHSDAEVVVIAAEKNVAPTAVVGPDQSVLTGTRVVVSAVGSFDPNGDVLHYNWLLTNSPQGSTAQLQDVDKIEAYFTPDIAGVYQIQLVVSDQFLSSEPVIVSIMAGNANVAPVAIAGPDQQVATGNEVQLNGSASTDANNDELTFKWSFVSKPADSKVVLENDQLVVSRFTPDLAGSYVVRLSVSDGVDTSVDELVVNAVISELQLFEKDLFFGFRRIPLPYTSTGITNASVIGTNSITLGEYRLTAVGQQFLITDLEAVDRNGRVKPSFIGINDGLQLMPGNSVDFKLVSELTSGQKADLLFRFGIQGVGYQFTVQRTLTTN